MKRLIVSSTILFVGAWMPAVVTASPVSTAAGLSAGVSALVGEQPRRVEDLVPSPAAVVPEPTQLPEAGEPIAIPLPTALQAGMSVFGMFCVYRLARRIRLAA